MEQEVPVLTEIPVYLKQLARIITRGFYQIEDALIMDMLVRNTCMKEKDLEDLLKFDLKLLRARMATLKNEKLVQVRLRMETGPDGKAQKVNYYFINYKSLVNVIKYKLDHIRKRIETQARDATNRASFKCTNCSKTFTDLEAGELYDMMTNQWFCTFCRCPVEEDESGVPQKDSRVMLARFNEQLQPVFDLLRSAENIRLAPELLEPEPMKSPGEENESAENGGRDRGGIWSGEASRRTGSEDTKIAVAIGDAAPKAPEKKEKPIWMTESTIGDYDRSTMNTGTNNPADDITAVDKSSRDDIMSVLLTFEKREPGQNSYVGRDNESDGEEDVLASLKTTPMDVEEVGTMDSDDDEDQVAYVSIGNRRIPLASVTEEDISTMTKAEKEAYIQLYQESYAHLYD